MENKNLITVQSYYKFINEGCANSEKYYQLFSDDVEIFYPKFGFGKGREGLQKFGQKIIQLIDYLEFDLEKFNYIENKEFVIVEGHEKGITNTGIKFPNNTDSFGKFCSVFQLENNKIKRMHCYVDPDFASQDIERLRILNTLPIEDKTSQTKKIVDEFYDIQFGRRKGNLIDLFADKVDWDLPGNKNKFSWVGKRETKEEVQAFFYELSKNIESEKFEIDFITVNGENATVVGSLVSKILPYNKSFSTTFVVILKVVDEKIVKYHFLEDSYKLNEEMR
ncbi:nuclear transport factor 2 family protein [Chishuiella sp.]|uniref:nuclear transport factor 2 family protein n=1 Tax=Chishuiella sp. TaxID=1969467 RepID=UPI0028A64E8D|nr:nuclear transport factor 2 family protein [Chishuiella sp.]